MLLPMPPMDSVFLMVEAREHPMHVGGLQLFRPPDGADSADLRGMFEQMIGHGDVAPLFRKRPRRSVATAGLWGWEDDERFDIEHHVRHNALPRPGRILELLALCSRLHGSLLDRHRPLWEMHLIEGLADGRFAMYFKVHHALVDGVAAQRLVSSVLSRDPDRRDMPPPWASHEHPDGAGEPPTDSVHAAIEFAADAAGIPAALLSTLRRGLHGQPASLSLSAPKTMLNVPITGARRFAAQSWPIERLKRVGTAAGATVNDVVLAMCAGALRRYLLAMAALPDAPLVAMVPVALRGRDRHRDGGNAVGAVMCNLGTQLADPAHRLATVHASMTEGKAVLSEMTPVQILAMSALGLSPLVWQPLLRLSGVMRPPFNLIVSNVPGSRVPLYYNGARLDGLWPLSVPYHGQALNITCTSYAGDMAFGLTGCRRSVPHLQRLLGHLDDELAALERATGVG